MSSRFDISADGWDRRSLTYFINGEPVSTLLKDVHKRIRARVAVPGRVIKAACLLAKEAECEVRIWLDGLDGWRMRRK